MPPLMWQGEMRMKLITVASAALIFAMPVEAFPSDVGDSVTVAGWEINPGDEACQAFKIFEEYKTGKPVSLSIIYNARTQNPILSFSNTVATSVTDGQKVTLTIFLIHPKGAADDGWGEQPFTVRILDEDIFFNSSVLDKEILADFAKSETLAFFVSVS